MLLIEEQRSLIEKFVKSNKNYRGNEDLFEDFCSEAFQKSYMVFNSVSNVQKIESYVAKVVHTSILNVLKNSGRIRRANKSYVATNEIKVPEFSPSVKVKSRPLGSEFIMDFPDPKETVEEILITKDCLQRIADAVCIIHKEVPSQNFYEIFYLRYVKGEKQAQIAEALNLSQSEVSKRLMQLSKLISNLLDRGKS
ncbi:MAG: sigma-70 family RNA polymerase sigma factor [Candidatus Gastranaerophilales bacterium]|nr:sigma-70 family RNA polymerase sigma factor [Candidatus Gastranaerophilales bacterium]